jgi:hypothetical protein
MKVWRTLVYVRDVLAHHEERDPSPEGHGDRMALGRRAKSTKGLDFSDFLTLRICA